MEQSHAVTQSSASNLALAFILLPRPQRDAMSALYAFCRAVDDVADEDTQPVAERRAKLAAWRDDIHRACTGGTPEMPTNREFQPFIERHQLPFELFDELIRGCETDLEKTRYADYAELEQYCYRVASVVGLLSAEIFGLSKPASRAYGLALGQSLQLTNILRDVGNDAQRGRIYLPKTELDRFQVREEEILRGEYSDRFQRLAESVAQRARGHYRRTRDALLPAERQRAVASELMAAVYWKLLLKLERHHFPVLAPEPMKLSKRSKLLLLASAAVRKTLGLAAPPYG
jgi:phytoene synthase